jgi:hypothetical protein
MLIVTVCQEMGWTYREYLSQPEWFVGLLFEKLKIDNKNAIRNK